jgi:hypothetical protein
MTPKEKAKELVDNFDICLNNIMIGSNGLETILRERAIACALITVNEMLNVCQIESEPYYKEVKNEILKAE